jgi:hypothetical protein
MVNEKVSVIDVKGELTAFAEGVLMHAYIQDWHRTFANGSGGGSRKVNGRSTIRTPPRIIRAQFRGNKHTSLTFFVGESSELQFSLAQIALLVTPFVTFRR